MAISINLDILEEFIVAHLNSENGLFADRTVSVGIIVMRICVMEADILFGNIFNFIK